MAKLTESQRAAALVLVDLHVTNARKRISEAMDRVDDGNRAIKSDQPGVALDYLTRASVALGEAAAEKLWTTGRVRGELESLFTHLDDKISRLYRAVRGRLA